MNTATATAQFAANLTTVTTEDLHQIHEQWFAVEGLVGPHMDLIMAEFRSRKVI